MEGVVDGMWSEGLLTVFVQVKDEHGWCEAVREYKEGEYEVDRPMGKANGAANGHVVGQLP